MRLVLVGIVIAAAGCDGGRTSKPKKRSPAVAHAASPEPPPPRPPPLPAGSVCCDATVRGDHLVQVTSEETCTKLKGTHAAVEACWLPDPPQVSGLPATRAR